jgi:MOSC domain-containing protein YiiM
MSSGKVLSLYMAMPDLMRKGYRMLCEDFECDEDGIVDDMNYGEADRSLILLVSKKSYELIEEAELFVDEGVLLENIYVDIDLYHLGKGAVIEIGDTLFEVIDHCPVSSYLMALDPQIPAILEGNRGLFVRAMEYGRITVGQKVNIIKV